ncbi:MAG: hypothetical protein F6K63_06060 [Moorea sp. SIO1G6]|uniref:Uncharacterized protein n=1 Tax=Moorena producens (strain JHB) TaxID=1454205 RepID=A0A9Q9SSW8_MOOP1|nr:MULTISPECIES: hypothetical protein [Moorena]NES82404.1 hypothetical protein [Moorena sp. SIO2B7]NET63990.1 hypothetical protein [Moorena sp. SIO1G6]WAN69059.1 hypothetical protein BJP36_42655 [Moorena producens JHB]
MSGNRESGIGNRELKEEFRIWLVDAPQVAAPSIALINPTTDNNSDHK